MQYAVTTSASCRGTSSHGRGDSILLASINQLGGFGMVRQGSPEPRRLEAQTVGLQRDIHFRSIRYRPHEADVLRIREPHS